MGSSCIGWASVSRQPLLTPALLWATFRLLCQILIVGFFFSLEDERVTPLRERKIWPIACSLLYSSVQDAWLPYAPVTGDV